MHHHIIKSLVVLALGAMLLTAFCPMSKGEHELVGSWQYVKSAVAIHWDDPAPFHDSAAQDEEKSERKDMTINADGSMTMVARDIESNRVYRVSDSCAMKFKSYDLTWVLSAATNSLKVISPSGGQRDLENRPVGRKHSCLCCGQAF